ncbi:MAG: VPDSG-CTERM sorting domain-containing protein [Opitutaceae bacterium]|nr:VPDSG-CTERM sorting domain-containing protein [Opitutaceae bacterium]
MKTLALFTLALVGLMSSARATIITNLETSTQLNLTFDVRDYLLTPGGTTETYTMTLFPGTSLTFFFQDRVLIVQGNQEQFSSNPSSGSYNYVQDTGDLDFSGSYVVGTTVVNWNVDSKVGTGLLRQDRWYGTFSAVATNVPDAASTAALLGVGLIALGALRRRR